MPQCDLPALGLLRCGVPIVLAFVAFNQDRELAITLRQQVIKIRIVSTYTESIDQQKAHARSQQPLHITPNAENTADVELPGLGTHEIGRQSHRDGHLLFREQSFLNTIIDQFVQACLARARRWTIANDGIQLHADRYNCDSHIGEAFARIRLRFAHGCKR